VTRCASASTVDSKAVNRAIRAAIRPALQAQRFALFTDRTFWRHRANRVHVVNFQSFNDYLASSVGVTTFSFAVNLGQYLTCVPPDDFEIPTRKGLLAPAEYQCHLRLRPLRRLAQTELERRDLWYIDPDGSNLDPAIGDAREVIMDSGLTWFDRWSTDESVDVLLRQPESVATDGTDVGGTLGSPSRDLVHGYVLRSIGQSRAARDKLESALQRFRAIAEAVRSPRSPRAKHQPPAWVRLERDVAALAAS
jgi:uncharacterized protein DUF4304